MPDASFNRNSEVDDPPPIVVFPLISSVPDTFVFPFFNIENAVDLVADVPFPIANNLSVETLLEVVPPASVA